jgi:formylglycine-generating enzyme required for sulfatase activity
MLQGLTPVYTKNGSTDPKEWGIIPDYQMREWDSVTWNRNANGYRLPTEAEWEYACRAGTTTAYYTGDTITDETGWYNDNSGGKTHEVGVKPANPWGLYDMAGNVYEWCWDDWMEKYPSEEQNEPMGHSAIYPFFSRVTRGGAWFSHRQYLRSANRNSDYQAIRVGFVGLRLVRNDTPEKARVTSQHKQEIPPQNSKEIPTRHT